MLEHVMLPLLFIVCPPLLFAALALIYGVDSRDRGLTYRWEEPMPWL